MKKLINFRVSSKDELNTQVQNTIRSAKWVMLLVSILIFSFGNVARAQYEPEQLFQDWKRELTDIGISVSNASVQYDSVTDQLTIPNLSIRFSNTFDLNDTMTRYGVNEDQFSSLANQGVSIDFSYNSPKMVMHGMEGDANSIKISKVENIDPVSIHLDFNLGDRGKIIVSFRLSGWETEEVVHALPSSTGEIYNGSKLSWAQLFRFVGSDRYEYGRIEKFEYGIEFTKEEEQVFKLEVEDHSIELLDYDDGIIGECMVANHKSDLEYLSVIDRETETESATSSQIRVERFNLRSLFDLLDFPNAESPDRITLLGESSTNLYVANRESSSLKIERQLIENIGWKQPELDLFGIMVLSILDANLISTKLSTDLIKFFYSLEVGSWKLFGLEATDQDEAESSGGGKVTYEIDEIRLVNFSGNGLEELAVLGLNSNTYLEDDSLKLGKFSLNSIEFAPYEEIEDFLDMVETSGKFPDDPVMSAKYLLPRTFSLDVNDIEFITEGNVDTPKINLKIGRISKSMSTVVPPIPTNIAIEGNEIVIPVEQLQDEQVIGFLKGMDIDELNISYSARLYWKESSEELILEDLKLNVKDFGVLEASARLSGLKKSVLESPQSLQIGMGLISFDFAKLKFIDKGSTQKLIEVGAKSEKVSDVEFAKSLAEIARLELERLLSEEFAELVEAELIEFLLDPKDFSLEFTPKKPVNVFKLLAAAAIPSSIPKLLNADVKANQ